MRLLGSCSFAGSGKQIKGTEHTSDGKHGSKSARLSIKPSRNEP